MDDRSPLLEREEDESEDDTEAGHFRRVFTVSSGIPGHQRNPLENLDLDKLLVERIGQFGRYQKVIYLLTCLPAILTAIITLASVFTTIAPKHRCYVPTCDSPVIPHYNDATTLSFQNFTIPLDKNHHMDSCSRFKGMVLGNFICDMIRTVAMEFDLVCDRKGQVDLSQSIFFGGVLAGASVFGQLGDLIGRKPVFMITLVQTLVGGFAMLYAPDLVLYNILQFIAAMGQVGLFQTCFVLGVELVGLSYRVFCGVVIEFFFVAGELILAGLAYYFRDWRKMALAYMIPSLGLLTLYFIIPRSVRWLLANKRYLEAEAELQRVAKWNKVPPLTDYDFAKYTKEEVEIEVKESFFDLLKRPKLVIRILIIFVNWTVVAMVYYGLSLAASTLGGDVFMNFTLLSAMEFPGYGISYFGMQYWGRKSTMIASLLVSGLACLVSGFLPASQATLHTFLFLVGKFGVTSAFATIYLYTSELFPTSVRNLCLGLSSMVGRVGSIMAPYIKNLGADSGQDWIPLFIFGVAGIISGLANFLLHETKDKPLPRTLDEAEQQERS